MIINPHRFAAAAGSAPDIANLSAYWEMEETSGNRTDSHGSFDLPQAGTVGYDTGLYGNAADCDGSQNFALNYTDGTMLGGTGVSFSCVGWCKVSSSVTTANEAWWWDWQGGNLIFIFNINSGGFYYLHRDGGTTNKVWTRSGYSLADDDWHMIALGFDAGSGEQWVSIDGEPKVIGPYSGMTRTTGGLMYLGDGNPLGLVDECSAWQTMLSDDEISWLYNSGSGRQYSDL